MSCGCGNNTCGCDANTDCTCQSPCVSCDNNYALKEVCCNRCGDQKCNDSKSCCTGNSTEGPEEVTDEELAEACAWLWISIVRNCCTQPVRVSPSRFKAFLLANFNFDDLVDPAILEAKICEFLEEKGGDFVTQSQLVNINAKLGLLCSDVLALQTFVNTLNLSQYLTEAQIITLIENAGQGLTEAEVNTLIATALENYYTRTQVNDLIDNLQQQINNLQQQIDDCDCGGTTTTPPTMDFEDILTTSCPASVSSAISGAAGFTFTYASTGPGSVTVTVGGVVVTNPFTATDADLIEITVDGNSGQNAVGGITVSYDDGNGNTGIVDGFQYDITCPAANPLVSPATCPHSDTDEENAIFNVTYGPFTGGTPPYVLSFSGLPASVAPTDNGDGTWTISGNYPAAGTVAYDVTATDANAEVAVCSGEIVSTPVAQSGAQGSGRCGGDGVQPEPRVWCGYGTIPNSVPANKFIGNSLSGTICGNIGLTEIIASDDLNQAVLKFSSIIPGTLTQINVSGGTTIDTSTFSGALQITITNANLTSGTIAGLATELQGSFTVTGNC